MNQIPLFLAPMEGVTDLPYRLLAKECGADFTITEFTSSSGLSRNAERSWKKMATDSRESPFIPQIFGGNVDEMVETVRLLCEEGKASIIDINFGCPAPKVCRSWAGAAMMGDPDRLVSLVQACIDESNLPITAKLRIGTGSGPDTILEISKRLEEIGVSRICIHGRTLKQRYSGVADWSTISKVVDAVSIPVIANGDITDSESALKCLEETGAAGLMIGRAAIGNPQIFYNIKSELGWINEPSPWENEDLDKWNSATEIEKKFIARSWAWRRYLQYAKETETMNLKSIRRHGVSFTKHLPGGSNFRSKIHMNKDLNHNSQLILDWLESFAFTQEAASTIV